MKKILSVYVTLIQSLSIYPALNFARFNVPLIKSFRCQSFPLSKFLSPSQTNFSFFFLLYIFFYSLSTETCNEGNRWILNIKKRESFLRNERRRRFFEQVLFLCVLLDKWKIENGFFFTTILIRAGVGLKSHRHHKKWNRKKKKDRGTDIQHNIYFFIFSPFFYMLG